MSKSSSQRPLLSSSCSLPERTLWFGKIKLFDDHIFLTGWRWTGRYTRRFELDKLERVQWWSVPEGVNFMFHLENGKRFPLRIEEGAGLWHWKLKEMTDSKVEMSS